MAEIFYVYILGNLHHNVFYVGVTNDLIRRVWEHKNKLIKGFSYRYNVDKLLYYDCFGSIELAILQEKRIKRWARPIKCEAISRMNPEWIDLYTNLSAESLASAITPSSDIDHGGRRGIPGQARDDSKTKADEIVA